MIIDSMLIVGLLIVSLISNAILFLWAYIKFWRYEIKFYEMHDIIKRISAGLSLSDMLGLSGPPPPPPSTKNKKHNSPISLIKKDPEKEPEK